MVVGHPKSTRSVTLVPCAARVRCDALEACGLSHRRGSSYLVMEGPQFSSRSESLLYRAAGLDVIGMSAMPEAALAREAELCYQTVAMVTDFDAWHGEH